MPDFLIARHVFLQWRSVFWDCFERSCSERTSAVKPCVTDLHVQRGSTPFTRAKLPLEKTHRIKDMAHPCVSIRALQNESSKHESDHGEADRCHDGTTSSLLALGALLCSRTVLLSSSCVLCTGGILSLLALGSSLLTVLLLAVSSKGDFGSVLGVACAKALVSIVVANRQGITTYMVVLLEAPASQAVRLWPS